MCLCDSTYITSSAVMSACVSWRTWLQLRSGNVADTKGRQPLFVLAEQSAWHQAYHQSSGGLAVGLAAGNPNVPHMNHEVSWGYTSSLGLAAY